MYLKSSYLLTWMVKMLTCIRTLCLSSKWLENTDKIGKKHKNHSCERKDLFWYGKQHNDNFYTLFQFLLKHKLGRLDNQLSFEADSLD